MGIEWNMMGEDRDGAMARGSKKVCCGYKGGRVTMKREALNRQRHSEASKASEKGRVHGSADAQVL